MKSSKHVFVPSRLITLHQLVFGVDADLSRLLEQRHSSFLGSSITFPVVASGAGSDEILPSRRTTPRLRYHVIQRHPKRGAVGCLGSSTILASGPIPEHDAFSRDRFVLARNSPIVHQSNHARERNVDLGSVHGVFGDVLDDGGAFEDQGHRASRCDHVDRLVRGVDHEH